MEALISGPSLVLGEVAGSVSLSRTRHNQLVFVCAASGFAQALAMLSSAIHAGHTGKLSLVWCADSPAGFYARDRLANFGQHVAVHLFVDARRSQANLGLRWLHDHAADFITADLFLCGSPAFVYSVTDELIAAGIRQDQLHSDVYDYAPR